MKDQAAQMHPCAMITSPSWQGKLQRIERTSLEGTRYCQGKGEEST